MEKNQLKSFLNYSTWRYKKPVQNTTWQMRALLSSLTLVTKNLISSIQRVTSFSSILTSASFSRMYEYLYDEWKSDSIKCNIKWAMLSSLSQTSVQKIPSNKPTENLVPFTSIRKQLKKTRNSPPIFKPPQN